MLLREFMISARSDCKQKVTVCALLCRLMLITDCTKCKAWSETEAVQVIGDYKNLLACSWNDVSWNNPDILTPNLQNLAENGVILNSSYVQPVCTPTRSSFLTGIYPYHLGLQTGIISKDKAQFLTTNYSTLPEKLSQKGYSSHIVGKWHLGNCNWDYTPTFRGFDSHGGLLLGSGDHYAHTTGSGFDFWQNQNVDHTYDGNHSTDAFTDMALNVINNHDVNDPLFLYVAYTAAHTPLQAEPEYEAMYSHVANDDRRKFSAMVTHLDSSVGAIRQALDDKGMLDNLLLVFLSDNGGDVVDGGNNFPLRGTKGSLWEGAMRTPAFVYSKTLLNVTGYTQSEFIHATDWFPTFLNVAGVFSDDPVDGVNQWEMLSNAGSSSRTEFVYNINSINGKSAIRVGDYKLIEGNAGRDDDVYQVPTSRRRRAVKKNKRQTVRYRLFNIADDPDESHDLINTLPDIAASMKTTLSNYQATEHPVNIPPSDPASKPRNYGGVWSPGWCTGGL